MDLLNDINDTRNGILLNTALHPALDKGFIAFLKTPNFALSVDDIPYQQPHTGSPASRFTLQHLQPSELGVVIPLVAPHNTDARQPEDVSQWPVAITADLIYGASALKAWGSAALNDYIWAISKDSYYDEGGEEEDEEDEARYNTQSVTKAAINPANQPTLGDMLDVVVALWRQPAREGERKLPGDDGADVANNENKVQTWLQSMEGSTS